MREFYHDRIAPDGSQLGRAKADFAGMKASVAERVAAKAAAIPYVTPDQIAELTNAELARVRSPLSFIDLTYSAHKSVSVAHAGYLAAAARARDAGARGLADRYQAQADGIIDALQATANAIVATVKQTVLCTRTGAQGREVRDAKGATAAVFVQHTSRDGDPQLHAHIALLNLVQRADAVDSAYRTLGPESASAHRRPGPGHRQAAEDVARETDHK